MAKRASLALFGKSTLKYHDRLPARAGFKGVKKLASVLDALDIGADDPCPFIGLEIFEHLGRVYINPVSDTDDNRETDPRKL